MSLLNKLKKQEPVQQPAPTPIDNTPTPNQLTLKELEMLLGLIKTSTFLGEDIEVIYIMVAKLQNQYLEQKNK
jgi:hypothetical protein